MYNNNCTILCTVYSLTEQNAQLQFAYLPVWLVIDVYNGITLCFAAWLPYLRHITLCASACLINMLKQVWSSYCKMVIKDMAYAGLMHTA